MFLGGRRVVTEPKVTHAAMLHLISLKGLIGDLDWMKVLLSESKGLLYLGSILHAEQLSFMRVLTWW